MAAALAMLVGGISCSKDNSGQKESNGQGNLVINFGFEEATKAPTSDKVVPITTWTNNIKEMSLLLVNGGIIKDVRNITIENANNHNEITRMFEGIEAGTYEAYIIANYNQTTTPFGAGKVNPSSTIGSTLKGSNINSLLFNLATVASPIGNDPAGSTVMGEPAEIFLAKQTGITITADNTYTHPTAFKLTRAVSLLRVRINQAYNPTLYPGSVDNTGVDFKTQGKTNLRLRLHGTGINVGTAANATTAPYGIEGITALTANSSYVLYSDKKFKTATDFVASQYGNGADMGLNNDDFTLWNEYMMLPGGSKTTGALKFNVALGGWAPQGYLANSSTGTVPVPQGGAMVYWAGQVTGDIAPNGIIELNLRLETAGTIGPDVPPVADFGNLVIDVDLTEWGATTYVNIPL